MNCRCTSGDCLRAEEFCDGKEDCEDGSDEISVVINSTSGLNDDVILY